MEFPRNVRANHLEELEKFVISFLLASLFFWDHPTLCGGKAKRNINRGRELEYWVVSVQKCLIVTSKF